MEDALVPASPCRQFLERNYSPMAFQETNTEAEQLKTKVEELENALERILDALRDSQLSAAERVERAAAIAAHTRAGSQRRLSRRAGSEG